MANVLTFIIPIRHPDNASNWDQVRRNLSETIKSISAQSDDNYKAVIVANHGSDLPDLPEKFEVKWVDFLPNAYHEEKGNQEAFFEAVRLDKGRRILAGMLHAQNTGHFMLVDDDDFINRNIVSFVAKHPNDNGWYIKHGYIWGEGGKLLCIYDDFNNFCGTSHIVKRDLYKLPKTLEEASDTYVKNMLGSHIFIKNHLEETGTPLAALPFIGAIYRVGHINAHSKSKGLIRTIFVKKALLKKPHKFIKRILSMRLVTKKIRHDFFAD